MTRTTRTITRGRRALTAACGLALALAAAADARLGDFDPGFGAGGVATPDVGALSAVGAELEGVVTRPDGTIVAGGWASNPSGFDEPLLVQLSGGGTPDPGFGATGPGFTRIASTGAETRLHGVALDGAGRVLAAAGRTVPGGPPVLPVALRFTATGTPDTSFGGAIGSLRGEARAIVPAGAGALVAGWRGNVNQEGFFVAKLTASGGLDGSFGGGDGIADPFGPNARAEALAIDATGRIVVAGWRQVATGSGTVRRAVIARLTPAGALDPSFGSGGIVDATGTNPEGQAVGELHAVHVDGAGRIVAAGASARHAFVTRRLGNGAPDTGFGTGGATFGTLPESAALSALAPDGARTIVAGRTSGTAPGRILLGALGASGAPDSALGGTPPGWRAFASPAPGHAEALAATPGPSGSTYTAGSLQGLDSRRTPFVARHLPNAPPAAGLDAPARALTGAPVPFDAAGSRDPEGQALRYAFDLDGNGSYEFDGGANPFALRSFPAPGTYTVGVRVTDPRGAGAATTRSVTVTAAQVPRPLLGKQGVAQPLRGIIRIRLPGRRRFVRITELTAIPNGTEIDARRGRVLLTVLHDASGRLDGAKFYGGRFIFRQGKGRTPITRLKLSGGSFAACRAPKAAARTVLAVASTVTGGKRKRRVVRKLWGDGRGRFRTRGRYGAATVRGTKWLTVDRCDGTKVRVVRGKVAVRDLVRPRRRATLLTDGERILVRAKRRG